jgi:hypothetical protein
MPLSTRAQAYLATLCRYPAVPVADVAEALRRAECVPYPSWLDFHERYAGYVDPLGQESAILGLVHRESYWLTPGEASVEQQDDGRYSVTCAEVHASFDYRLFEDGSFSSFGGGGPCESFDVKIEQSAVLAEAWGDGRKWLRYYDLTTLPEGGLRGFCTAVGAELVPEASDKFAEVWRGHDAIWLAERETGGSLILFTPESERTRIGALLADPRQGE